MWKNVQINGDSYLVKHEYSQFTYNLHITNLMNLWHETISTESIIKRCRDMNKFLEADDETFIDKIFQLLYDDQAEKLLTFCPTNETGSLILKTNMDGINFHFKFELLLASSKILFQEVTANLLIKIQNLKNAQENLIEVIHRKDVEIDQYKIEGYVLSRKLVETEKFVDEEFKKKYIIESWPSCIKNTLEDVIENDCGINKFIEKNLDVELDIKPKNNLKASLENKHSLQGVKKFNRRRIYAKHLSPTKLKYDSLIKDSEDDVPPIQVKIEDGLPQ